ncbi:MAG: iron-containing alcohol dehydrogenase [Anaerolineae bacterium]|nr:iron-containing alcohol dehydrogenase [Anaerolineae bacterium]NIN93957.1 iron-containing alcohol dehydrogenase [Anaerolineae bacterium]NIQ76990.1 iron-containing alcohol dehydrogenase [Anaerolineae bacterium]
MWYFESPKIVFGEGALARLEEIEGLRAFVVTDENLVRLGFAQTVRDHLGQAGLESTVFSQVEPDPSLKTVVRGAEAVSDFRPDWIVGLGGGSCMDAAKAMWVLYERPDIKPEAINPIETLGLRKKARLITIPTTAGTGAEATWAIVLTDTEDERKLGLGSRENLADIAIVDPSLSKGMPPRLTADTGLDALTHAVEGYAASWANDFCDGMCLKAADLIFRFLPRAYDDGSDDEAREKMANAATLAGLGFGNSMAGLAHSLGQAIGGVFHTPHGRAVGLFLPYTIEYAARENPLRYAEMARYLGLPCASDAEGAQSLARSIRELLRRLEQPLRVKEVGIERHALQERMEKLIENAENEAYTVVHPRVPTAEELEHLFVYAHEGKVIDF